MNYNSTSHNQTKWNELNNYPLSFDMIENNDTFGFW